MFGHNSDDQNQNKQQSNKPSITEPVADASLATGLDATQVTVMPAGPPPMNGSPVLPPKPKTDIAALAGQIGGASVTPMTTSGSEDLLAIKKQALEHLNPLVSHLDQAPEEKFKTTMMMIQATDDQSLIKAAYEAANAIEDKKTRAQALLDVVNEINYFTQPQNPTQNSS